MSSKHRLHSFISPSIIGQAILVGFLVFEYRETRVCVKHAPSMAALFLLILAAQVVCAQPETTFRSQGNLVPVPTLVRDADGKAVYGLHAEDFIIEDDGVPQVVQMDDRSEPEPISLFIALQCGRRASREFERMSGLAAMLDPILSDSRNEAALLLFDRRLNLVRDFTNDEEAIVSDLKNLQPGDNGAAILDAVDYGAKLLAKRPEGRKRVLLLISETRDHGSHFARIDDAVRMVGVTNVLVYALPFSPYVSQQLDVLRANNKDEWTPGVDIFEKLVAARNAMKKNSAKTLAALTGGEYSLFMSSKAFEEDMTQFANHLSSRYALSFEPKNPHPGLHRIQVRLKHPGTNQSVLFRGSYWAGDKSR